MILSVQYSGCRSHVDIDSLTLNIHAVADGLARYLYNLSSMEGLRQGERLTVFPRVHSEYLVSWLDFLSSHARSPQLLTEDHPVVTGLYQVTSYSVCVCAYV